MLSQRAHERAAAPPTPTTRTALRREIYLLALTLEYAAASRYCAEAYTALVALLRASPPAARGRRRRPSAALVRRHRVDRGRAPPPPPPPPTRRRRRRCRRSRPPLSSLGADDADGGGGRRRRRALAAAVSHRRAKRATCGPRLPSAVALRPRRRALLAAAPADELPPALAPAAHAACVAQQVDETVAAARARVPPRMGRKAPTVALKQYNPVFDEEFDPNRSSDPDRRRAELQKLKRSADEDEGGAQAGDARAAQAVPPRRLPRRRRHRRGAAKREAESLLASSGRGKRALQIMEEQEASWKSMKRESSAAASPRALV